MNSGQSSAKVVHSLTVVRAIKLLRDYVRKMKYTTSFMNVENLNTLYYLYDTKINACNNNKALASTSKLRIH